MTRVVVAVPTIEARRHRRQHLENEWRGNTPHADLHIHYSTAGTTWGDGLNDIYQRTHGEHIDVFVCGSDDMRPANQNWLPAILPWLQKGYYPAPRVQDPRFDNHGGHPRPVPDGTLSRMSTFPILRGDWLDKVFPLPEGLHYFADNLVSVAVHYRCNAETVAVPSCHIIHDHAPEGRGAGYGSENVRLHVDTVRYTKALQDIGIDRETLPPDVRGGMWEERFLEVGRALGG